MYWKNLSTQPQRVLVIQSPTPSPPVVIPPMWPVHSSTMTLYPASATSRARIRPGKVAPLTMKSAVNFAITQAPKVASVALYSATAASIEKS